MAVEHLLRQTRRDSHGRQVFVAEKEESYRLFDSGYFFCPYVPLTQTPVVLDPEAQNRIQTFTITENAGWVVPEGLRDVWIGLEGVEQEKANWLKEGF